MVAIKRLHEVIARQLACERAFLDSGSTRELSAGRNQVVKPSSARLGGRYSETALTQDGLRLVRDLVRVLNRDRRVVNRSKVAGPLEGNEEVTRLIGDAEGTSKLAGPRQHLELALISMKIRGA